MKLEKKNEVQKQPSEVFYKKKGVLENFTKLTGKRLAEACNFIKKETLAQVFPCEFCEIFKNTFFYGTTPGD